jgi:hypothetical protein
MTGPFWTEEETLRFEMNMAFCDYADAEEGELVRLRVLLGCLLTDLLRDKDKPPTAEEVCAILRRFHRIMGDPKAWADWIEEAHEIARYTAECMGGGEIFARA